MRAFNRYNRKAFSLLEMVLALALGMVLLLALYFTLNIYVTSAHIGRDTLAEGEIARSVVTRLTHDITNQLGPVDVRCVPDYSSLAPTETMPTDPAAKPMTPTQPAMPAQPAISPDAVKFNIGVVGTATTLSLSVYKVENPSVGAVANQTQAVESSDLRRIDYWIVGGGSMPLGLARREVKLATSNDVDLYAEDIPEPEKYIIAREVTSIEFEYFDGQTWSSDWDGSSPLGEDTSPVGPPAAIRIKVTMKRSSSLPQTLGLETVGPDLTYTHVVALPGGNYSANKLIVP